MIFEININLLLYNFWFIFKAELWMIGREGDKNNKEDKENNNKNKKNYNNNKDKEDK